MFPAVLSLPCLLLYAQAPSLPPPAPPATIQKEKAMHQAFDFWIGTWEVRSREGVLLGHNRIEPRLNGAVLQEHWEGAKGGQGTSLNAYQPTKGLWRQTWLDHQGSFLDLEGGPEGNSMVLRGATATKEGTVAERITWTPQADGRVLQLWEQSSDGGKTWKVAFEGFYLHCK